MDKEQLRKLIEVEHAYIPTQGELSEHLRLYLKSEGYSRIRAVEGFGVCGLLTCIMGEGLFVGLDYESNKGFFLFEDEKEARQSIDSWDPSASPLPPGNWRSWNGAQKYYALTCQVCSNRVYYINIGQVGSNSKDPILTANTCTQDFCPFT